jgi:hypothetical protein
MMSLAILHLLSLGAFCWLVANDRMPEPLPPQGFREDLEMSGRSL